MTHIKVNRESTAHQQQICFGSKFASVENLPEIGLFLAIIAVVVGLEKSGLETESSKLSLNRHRKEINHHESTVQLQYSKLVSGVV